MKPITQEWVDKAEGDWAALGRELRARKAPNYDDACFHAQQCAERYLKARLQEASIAFPRTHDLIDLLNLALPVEPLWSALFPAANAISGYAVAFRYPGRSATRTEAREAQRFCRTIREAVRLSLGLPVG
ncbi:MAG: HEPN domain-containing protein [Armatimonadetes bacterium]|nr:HEPN domain-containing protein [Armatimonadota bacterium]